MIGARVKRAENPRFLVGRGNYVRGMRLPNMAEMAVLRSPHAHARIGRIDAERARRIPGMIAVLTGADLRDKVRPLRAELDLEKNPNYKACDWYSLACDKVRHVGDGMTIVVARDRYLAEDAASEIEVEHEILEGGRRSRARAHGHVEPRPRGVERQRTLPHRLLRRRPRRRVRECCHGHRDAFQDEPTPRPTARATRVSREPGSTIRVAWSESDCLKAVFPKSVYQPHLRARTRLAEGPDGRGVSGSVRELSQVPCN